MVSKIVRPVLAMFAMVSLFGCGDEIDHGSGAAAPEAAERHDSEEDEVNEPLNADAIPVAHTPEGGYDEIPLPILAGCTEPLSDGAVDMRGWWEVTEVVVGGERATEHQMMGVRQRIEQCGNRVVITSGGVVHDMRVDGTEENGVNDVAEIDYKTAITVVATFEDGVHVLRPVGIPIEVTRTLDGDELLWNYAGIETRARFLGPVDEVPAD